jgi:hypothetical protein
MLLNEKCNSRASKIHWFPGIRTTLSWSASCRRWCLATIAPASPRRTPAECVTAGGPRPVRTQADKDSLWGYSGTSRTSMGPSPPSFREAIFGGQHVPYCYSRIGRLAPDAGPLHSQKPTVLSFGMLCDVTVTCISKTLNLTRYV